MPMKSGSLAYFTAPGPHSLNIPPLRSGLSRFLHPPPFPHWNSNPQEARTIAKRIDNITFPLDERAQFVAQRFTWASAGSPYQFGDGSNCCGKQMTITFQEVTTNATCVDRCMTCLDYGQLEFTKGLFGNFIDPIAGEIFGSWSFIDVSGGGNDSVISRSSGTSTHLASQTASVSGGGDDSVISRSSGTSAHLASQTANVSGGGNNSEGGNNSVILRSSHSSAHLATQTANVVWIMTSQGLPSHSASQKRSPDRGDRSSVSVGLLAAVVILFFV
ncbi:hypothetical protein B0H13DRAFT_1915975 [Mycena leptocephala]|nr:hypothetical protein B0H13DRAFT_1915975 [Mycena leptocephala]